MTVWKVEVVVLNVRGGEGGRVVFEEVAEEAESPRVICVQKGEGENGENKSARRVEKTKHESEDATHLRSQIRTHLDHRPLTSLPLPS